MSSRLSPAASLLRNSKLFALPAAVALPPVPPSSEQLPHSGTATTVYPRHASIETPHQPKLRGDWGFKRSLPLKSTVKTGTPVVRLISGIDTQEHVADFESAADHVLTLQKFQELNHPLRLPEAGSRVVDRRDFSVFRQSHDNTTNHSSSSPAHALPNGVWPNLTFEQIAQTIPESILAKQAEIDSAKQKEKEAAFKSPDKTQRLSPERDVPQEQRRWRYAGPSLLQMSGMEFDAYLKKLGPDQKTQLRSRVRRHLFDEYSKQAREEGRMDEMSSVGANISEDEVSHHLRELRGTPSKFGPLLAELLDLPEGQPPPLRSPGDPDPWEYGRDTLAAAEWRERGPPRTHPSAGLSYVHTTTVSENSPSFGPQKSKSAVLARAVRQRFRNGEAIANYGVAGFLVPKPLTGGVMGQDIFEPQPGGSKIPVIPGPASITETGTLHMQVTRASEYVNWNDRAAHPAEVQEARKSQGGKDDLEIPAAPTMSQQRHTPRQNRTPTRNYRKQEQVEPSQDVDHILEEMMKFREKVPPE